MRDGDDTYSKADDTLVYLFEAHRRLKGRLDNIKSSSLSAKDEAYIQQVEEREKIKSLMSHYGNNVSFGEFLDTYSQNGVSSLPDHEIQSKVERIILNHECQGSLLDKGDEQPQSQLFYE